MPIPFKSEKVLDERISDSTLKAYHVGFELNKFRLKPLVDILCRVIPEFSFGYHAGVSVPHTEMFERMQEAAEMIYQTDKFKRRGEFGELILHLLLRDFHNTIPLVSKIYFKDSTDMAVHGFDAVQVSVNGKSKKLWLEAHICLTFIAYKLYKELERQLYEKKANISPQKAIEIAQSIYQVQASTKNSKQNVTQLLLLTKEQQYLAQLFNFGC
jgi:hypothetical protein